MMLAFHNDPALKAFVLNELEAHKAADELVKGQYWEDGKGCAVGCTLEAVRRFQGEDATIEHGKHALYESRLGIPEVLARLEDRIFENLNNGASQEWPLRFTSAIRPGADLALVWPKFAVWLLGEFLPPLTTNERALKSLKEVAGLYGEWVNGAKPSVKRWKSATRAAARAAAYADAADAADDAANAARAAADAAAAARAARATYAASYAADAASYAAVYAADAAADAAAVYAAAYAAAAYAAAADAASYAAYAADAARAADAADAAAKGAMVLMADKLIEILADC